MTDPTNIHVTENGIIIANSKSDKLLKRILTEMSYVDLVSGTRSPYGDSPYLVIDSKLDLSQAEHDLIDLIQKEDATRARPRTGHPHMTTPKINLTHLRAAAEEANHPGSEYADVLAMFDLLGPATVLALLATAEAAIDLFDDQPEIQADYPQLHETLNQFDRTPQDKP